MSKVDKGGILSSMSRLSSSQIKKCADGEMKIRIWSSRHSLRGLMACKDIPIQAAMFVIFTAASRFRWAFCQLEALRHCLAPRVLHMLKELPKTLDETYERILRDIHEANRDHAHRLLQCLTVAARPLRVAELAEVLAVDFGTASRGEISKLNTDWRWEDQQEAVLSTCSSLISIVDEEGSQIVQFSHFSVKEFLTSSRIAGSSADVSPFHILLEPAHTVLAKACLAVLLRFGELLEE